MGFIRDHQTELGDRLHSVNLDMISDNHLKLLIIPCFGFLSLLYTGCLKQKWQAMEQYLKFNSMKALYILILQSFQESLILVQIRDNQFSKPLLAQVVDRYQSRNPAPLPPPSPDFVVEVKHWSGLDNVHIGTIRTIVRLIWGIGLALSPPTFIKLTHSRMSVGYHEWMVLFISVWRA